MNEARAQELLAALEGRTRRNRVLELVTQASPEEYRERYAERFVSLMNAEVEFTSEDITSVIGMPAQPNAVGGIFSGLLRQHREALEVTGLREMKRPGSHARLTRVYRRKK